MTLSLFGDNEPTAKAVPAAPITGDALLAGEYRSSSDDCYYNVQFKDGILWQSRRGVSEAAYGAAYTVTATDLKRLIDFKIFQRI